MAFYKNCICGKKVYAERRIDFPDLCPYCKRKLVGVSSQSDDVLCGDDNTQRNPESNLQDNEEKLISEKKGRKRSLKEDLSTVVVCLI